MDLLEHTGTQRRHPWEIERWAFFRDVLTRNGALHRTRVLDVGSGDSWMAGQLAPLLGDGAEVYCWDTNYTDDDLDDPPPGVIRVVDAPDGDFDLVMMMDVLEHIEHPVEFLRDEVAPRLAPGALVLASVPAHQWLFDDHDVALAHFRRYRPSTFVDQIAGVCTVSAQGPLFVSLVAPRLLAVVAGRVRSRIAHDDATADPHEVGVGGWSHGATVTRLVRAGLAADARFCSALSRRGRSLPGLSHWAIGTV